MSLIPISEKLNKTEIVAQLFSDLISENRTSLPKLSLPTILLAKFRPGLDADILKTAVISRFKEIGIPNGPLANGSPNVMEALVGIICEEIVDSIQNELRIDVAVDPGMNVLSYGANSGGPVVSNGNNVAPHSAVGVPR